MTCPKLRGSDMRNEAGEMVCPRCRSRDILVEGIACGVPTSECYCNQCGFEWVTDD